MRAENSHNGNEGRRPSALSFLKGAAALDKDRFLKAVNGLAAKEGSSIYLVGGFLRNLVLGAAAPMDYDFVTSSDVRKFSEEFALKLKGTAFLLDKEAPSWRVVIKGRGSHATFDFSPIKGGDITYDLRQRDFTVNAMALDIRALFDKGAEPFIDPCNGMKDALAKRLKAVSKDVFKEDPLRTIRGVRLSVRYGLKITPATLALMKKDAKLLERTSFERIREELVMIFSCTDPSKGVERLYSLGILDVIAPELAGWADVLGYNLLRHSLRTLDEACRILETIDTLPHKGELKAHFSGYDGPVSHSVFFRMSAFLHDIGKPLAISRAEGRLRFIGHDDAGSKAVKELLMRLRFSKSFSNDMARMVKNHHRVFMLAKLKEPTFKSKAHLFRAAGGEAGIDLLLLALADARATINGEDERLYALVRELIEFYYAVYTKKKPKPLMNGHEIMRTFKVPQGPMVGRIMGGISEGVEKGLINTKKDAIRYVKEWLKGKPE